MDIPELVISKRITREPRDYQKAGVTAIAAQQLFGSGVKLRPGQTIEYIITDSESSVPNDRVRAFALWEGWFGYDRKKYAAMLREAFEPFVLCIPKDRRDYFFERLAFRRRTETFPSLRCLGTASSVRESGSWLLGSRGDAARVLPQSGFWIFAVQAAAAICTGPTVASSRNEPRLAVALNCGIGSRSLNALVNALDKLHNVRGANSSTVGLKYWS